MIRAIVFLAIANFIMIVAFAGLMARDVVAPPAPVEIITGCTTDLDCEERCGNGDPEPKYE